MLTDLGPQETASEVDYDVTEASAPSHPNNQMLLAYWKSNMDAAGLVWRRDINPAKLKPVLGGFFIVEPVDDGRDLLYRLVGSQNERRLGMRFMGRRFTECYSADMAAEQIAFHNRVFATNIPAFLSGRLLGIDLEYVKFEASYLPVRSDDGGFQMLGGLYDMAETA
ncbi:MAG: PAS domain-containing protein [Parvibaculum sp.]|nr:PAS domain-containing protein [Parvibaculum sp.]